MTDSTKHVVKIGRRGQCVYITSEANKLGWESGDELVTTVVKGKLILEENEEAILVRKRCNCIK